jgi:ATP-binding cassette, subfamily B, bacterial
VTTARSVPAVGTGEARDQGHGFLRNAVTVLGLVWAAGPLLALLLLVVMVLSGVTSTATVWLQRLVLDGLVPGSAGGRSAPGRPVLAGVDGGHLAILAVLLGSVGLVSVALPHARRYAEAELRRRMGRLILDRVYRAVNSFPGLSRFESPVFSDKINVVQQISNSVLTRFVSGLMGCGQSLVTAAGMFATLVVISPVIAAIVGICLIPAITAQIANSRKRVETDWRRSPSARKKAFYGRLLTDGNAAKEVRTFGLGGFLHSRMLAELSSVDRGQQAMDRRIFSVEGSLALLAAVISGGGLIWVVRQAAAGRLSIGDVTMFTMAVVTVQSSLANLVARLADVYQSTLQFGHYTDVISVGPDLPLAAPPRPLGALRTGIELRDVWFRYDEQHPWVLQGVSMAIPYGTSVALIGLNGAGKSTLVKLICRMYDPQRGSIRWDGVDIREVAPDDLRQRIGTVFQDYMAYDLTAAENVGLGDLERLTDLERIRSAAGQAGVHDKISSLPRGYATMLSRIFFSNRDREDPETGVILSGGEWQRLALARGLMRADRDLLILDEPSAGLDAIAEHAIHQRLCAIREGRTSLLISHRLASVRDADMIFVLSGGRVIEHGTHQELMMARGEYHRLFTLQASGYENGDRAGKGQQPSPAWAGGRREAMLP